MKVLVGVASVAVVAFVGYFFWGEWLQSQAPSEAERAQEIAFQFAAEAANVADGNRLKVGLFCDDARAAAGGPLAGDGETLRTVEQCEAAGL